jgi:glycosyltransferase involved in cell wall biosynthesis
MMFCKNEVDVLPYTLPAALKLVDSLFISDDGSTDGSWELLKYFKQQYPDKIEHIQQEPKWDDQGQRASLLTKIQERYKPQDTWVQIVEADMMLHTTNIHDEIAKGNRSNISVEWDILNACRPFWEGVHNFYPHWPEDIQTIMSHFHWAEGLIYTYRPLPSLYFEPVWRPQPRGFGVYFDKDPGYKRRPRKRQEVSEVPLLRHYGYRGPTHAFTKYKNHPNYIPGFINRHGDNYTSIDTLMVTNPYFNGQYNRSKATYNTPEEAWSKRGSEY